MSALNWRRALGFDLETTGVDPRTARIVTAAVITTVDGEMEQPDTWLINPGVDIPPETTEIHGITNERVQAHGADPVVALNQIADRLACALRMGMPVVAYNAGYDWSVLHYELARYGLPSMEDRLDGAVPLSLLDPYVIDKAVHKYRKGSRKLGITCEYYGVVLENAHSADADALAAVRLMWAIREKYPHLRLWDSLRLYENQQAWAAEQAASLQAYFRSAKAGEKQDVDAVVDGSWPLQLGAGS